MINFKKAVNWFLRLFLLFISFIVIIVFIFALRPEYFIDDIELIIKDKILDSIDGELHIGSINGNFASGFKLNEVAYSSGSSIIFSAKEIYIDPDLSRIAFGKIAFSKVILTSMYCNIQSLQLDRLRFNGKPTISYFNIKIESLIINDGLFLLINHAYKVNGKVSLDYSNVVELDINILNINSPAFQDVLIFKGGNLIYNNEEVKLSNAIFYSDWVIGMANFIVNINDYQKSSATINIDKLLLESMNGFPINFNNLNVDIASNNRILNGIIKCDANIMKREYADILITGVIDKNFINIDNLSLFVEGQHIASTGIINILEKSWEVKATIDDFELTKNTRISGKVNLSSNLKLDYFNGSIMLINSMIDSIKIPLISGQFEYNNSIFNSDNITVKSEGHISNIKINSFVNTDNFNINGTIELEDFSNELLIDKYAIDSLNGDLKFSWMKNYDLNTIDLDINLIDGLLYENKFNYLNGNIFGEMVKDEFTGTASGKLIGWDNFSYSWDTISYSADIFKEKNSNYRFNAISEMGDSIYISAEQLPDGDFFISKCAGILKQNKLDIQSFFINKKDGYYHFPKLLINLGKSIIVLDGNYKNKNKYDISGNIQNLELNTLYSIIGKAFRINGLIESATINIENNNNLLNPNPIYFTAIDMKNGSIDDIQFNQLILTASYRHRRLLISDFRLDTHLGNINGDGWLNIGISDNVELLQNQDKLNLILSYNNIDLDRFNRYLPWGYESRGLMTGTFEISGSVEKPEIRSHINILKPGFDKINGEKLSGNIFYKENKLDFRNLLLQTNYGRYSGFGFLPLDLNLIIKNRADISKEPIDFVFTGTTNAVEFLPPYIEHLDSLTSIKNDEDSSNSYSIELLISGSLKNPIRDGKIVIKNGNLYLDPIDGSISNISGLLTITNNQLIINSMTGLIENKEESELMSLPILSGITNILEDWFVDKRIENNMRVTGSIDLTDFFKPKFALNLSGLDISLSSSYDLFHGSGSANINIIGSDTIYISGEFIPTPYNFTITNLGDEGSITDSEYLADRIIAYDIHVPMKDGIKVETENVNLLFGGDLNITKIGDENYNFSGKANIIDGNFYDNQGNIFQNTYGNILLTPTDNTPYINLHAQTKIEENIIDVSFIGYTDNPSLIFDSEDYTQTEILKILTFGNAEGLSNPDQTGNMLSNYLENEIEKTITRYSALDEFHLASQGSLLENMEGKEGVDLKLTVGKQFSNKIYLNTELDLNDIENSQYEATYRINQNTSIVGGLDENNLWHLSYRIKYYYK